MTESLYKRPHRMKEASEIQRACSKFQRRVNALEKDMKKTVIGFILGFLLILLFLAGCGQNYNVFNEQDIKEITDVFSEEKALCTQIKAVNTGHFNLYCPDLVPNAKKVVVGRIMRKIEERTDTPLNMMFCTYESYDKELDIMEGMIDCYTLKRG